MLIDFEKLKEVTIPGLNGGEGAVSAKMLMRPEAKLMLSRLPAGASIGTHTHETSGEVDYVLSGEGIALCDGAEERLLPGTCHYCQKGSSHAIANTGADELVLFTVVAEQ